MVRSSFNLFFPFFPFSVSAETVWVSCNDAGDCGGCSWNGGWDAAPLQVTAQVSDQRGLD